MAEQSAGMESIESPSKVHDARRSALVMLDTGDRSVLALNTSLESLINMYRMVHVHCNVNKLSQLVTPEEFEFVRSVLGVSFPRDVSLAQLEQDITKVLEFRCVSNRWSPNTRGLDLPQTSGHGYGDGNDGIEDFVCRRHVIFDHARRVSFVFINTDHSVNTACRFNPDFTVVQSFDEDVPNTPHASDPIIVRSACTRPSSSYTDAGAYTDRGGWLLRSIVHLKSCTLDDLVVRVSAYERILKGSADAATLAQRAEQHAVSVYVRAMYCLQPEDEARIHAPHLYTQITRALSKQKHFRDVHGLEHRLPGYLIGMGLIAQRDADGVYYSGIRERYTQAELKAMKSEDVENILRVWQALPVDSTWPPWSHDTP